MTEFTSLQDLESYIKEYEKQHFIQLWKRDARNIETMKKVCPHKLTNCNSELHYYSITFACSRGGRKFKTKSSGLRSSFTAKNECPMNIKIKLSTDGQKLQIASLAENHNHSIDNDTFRSLPKQRKLDSEEKIEAENLLQLKCNKKLLQAYLQNKTGKPVQLRDISNLKSSKHCSVTNLENVLKIIDVDGSLVQIAVDENNSLLGIYYQTHWMQSCFEGYPELLMLDGTYKLNNLDMPVYVLMSVNGNNEGDPVAIFVVTEETTNIIGHMIKVFKEFNPKWCSVKTMLTDKDFGEKSVLYAEFPDASHHLCMFHVLKRFRTAITTQSMDINSSERKTCLELLQKITFAKTESEYEILYDRLMNLKHEKVSDYYNKNWHGIKEEWVQCYRNKILMFGVRTTNHLESFNQKIKQVCDKFVNLESFFENFNILLNSITTKRNQTANSMVLKKQVTTFEQGSTEDHYIKLLTPHAFKLVNMSIQNTSKYEVSSDNSVYTVFSKDNQEKVYKVDTETYKCSCSFNITNYIPCCHIFAAKIVEKKDLYDEALVHKRHFKSTYIQLFKSSSLDFDSVSQSETVIHAVTTKKRTLTTQQKYKIAVSKVEKIASVISNFNFEEFNASCTELDALIEYWSQRKKIKICPVDKNQTVTSKNVEETHSQNQIMITETFLENDTSEIVEELMTKDIDTEIITENIAKDQTRQIDNENIRVEDEIQTENIKGMGDIDNYTTTVNKNHTVTSKDFEETRSQNHMITVTLLENDTSEIIEEIMTKNIDAEIITENITIIDQTRQIDSESIRVEEEIQTENIIVMVDIDNYKTTELILGNEKGEIEEELMIKDINTKTVIETLEGQSRNSEAVFMGSIKLPSVRKRRGRPKGHMLTAIGIKKSKKL